MPMIKSHYVPTVLSQKLSITAKPERVYVYRRDNKDPVVANVGQIAAVKVSYRAKLITTGKESDVVEKTNGDVRFWSRNQF